MSWNPSKISSKKAVLASHPELTARFVKETSLGKAELYPDIDHMDLIVRQESLPMVAGHPVMLQMCTVPAYALTVPISTTRTRQSVAQRSYYNINRSTRCSRCASNTLSAGVSRESSCPGCFAVALFA